MPNYLNQHYKNCMVDSKENDKFGLGVKGLTVFNAWLSCEFCLSNGFDAALIYSPKSSCVDVKAYVRITASS